jgi:hypothetical protein
LLYWQYERTTNLVPLQHRRNLSQEPGPVELAFGASRQAKLPVALTGRAVLRTIKILQKSRASLPDWTLSRACYHEQKKKVVPGIELGLPESESDVLTITLYNLWLKHFLPSLQIYTYHLAQYLTHRVSTSHPLVSANACLQQLDVE